MTIVVCISDREILFALLDDLVQRIRAWATTQDALIFQEQVATGAFRDKQKLSESAWEMVKNVQALGQIQPYYGASGGGYSYSLRIDGPQSLVKVTNTLLEEHFETTVTTKILQQTFLDRLTTIMQRSSHDNRLPSSISLRFEIAGKELDNLRTWKYWDRSKCLTGRYIYTFGGTTLGTAIKVTDITTSEMIDITDYSDW